MGKIIFLLNIYKKCKRFSMRIMAKSVAKLFALCYIELVTYM